MASVGKIALMVGAGFALFGATAGITSTVLQFRPPLLTKLGIVSQASPDLICRTIATDPNPPLNIRSSPVSAPDNVIGRVRNGTPLKVVDENQGWLRVVSPIEGWVYKELTVTSCIPAADARLTTNSANDGKAILQEATEFYHAGNLNAAIALAQTVPPSDRHYQTAQGAIVQWQQDWKTAESEFYAAQKAFRESRWQDVLAKVKHYPANRFWKAKLAPLVEETIKAGHSNKPKRAKLQP